MSVEQIIMNYWKSWHSHSNWDETRKYMHDDFRFDAGGFKTDSADELIGMMKSGNPWKDIRLLDFVVSENKGALVYEGTESVTDATFRIAEILTVTGDKVSACLTTIAQLPEHE